MMTKDQYIESLRKMNLKVYLMGERIENPADHPMIRPSMNSVAMTYELAEKEEYKDLMNRLSRIEGQVRGIRAMVERGAYCPDILVQTSAVNSALNSFSKVLLSNHRRTCVRNDIKDGNDEVVEELIATLQKMMK